MEREALQMCLEYIETNAHERKHVRHAIQAALAQPAQEPVAWAIYDKRGGSKSLHWPENHSPDGDATKFDAVPLYTTPPQREWVGLTDEERSKIWGGIIKYAPSEMRIKDFAQAIEAKLKEKNG